MAIKRKETDKDEVTQYTFNKADSPHVSIADGEIQPVVMKTLYSYTSLLRESP